MLPKDYTPYIDKYFLRAKEILEKENLNLNVTAQVFIRRGGVRIYGINKAVEIICKYANKVKIYALKEGSLFQPKETLMFIEAPIQEIIALETMYLGVLTAETTRQNDKVDVDYKKVRNRMGMIVELVDGRPISYFGARHWDYAQDYSIAKACAEAGAANCSTDIGAEAFNQKEGIGTIPHALEAIYHWRDGMDKAVHYATKAFDEHMDVSIPRIALVDYANKEVDDTLLCAYKLRNRLYGIRIDTCGENVMQDNCWFEKGVTVAGVYAVKSALGRAGFNQVNVILSSGFGDYKKVEAFLEAEKRLGKLFDGLGVGNIFGIPTLRMATMDIVKVDDKFISKVGREYQANPNLKRVV